MCMLFTERILKKTYQDKRHLADKSKKVPTARGTLWGVRGAEHSVLAPVEGPRT